jgi:hypothetical protein
VFAAAQLYEEAVQHSGLSLEGVVGPVVQKAAKEHKVKVTEPQVKVVVTEARAAVKEFKQTSLDDLPCFEQTIHRVETDIEAMRSRANAWAIGDIAALRALAYVDQGQACEYALLSNSAAQSRGLEDMREQVSNAWVDAVVQALARNESTVGTLNISQIFDEHGPVARLREMGYTVEAPE